jgi:hypothetical protein
MIPKIIHQTYKRVDNLPPVYMKCQQELQKLHPDWEYRFWTDEDMYREVEESFPELWPMFSKLPRKILQIDVFRYCLMWKYGGLYADLDYFFRKPFDTYLNETMELILPISRRQSKIVNRPLRFGNCIFASRSAHPFWKLVLADILTNQDRLLILSDSDVMDSENGTGPGFITRMYFDCDESVRKTIETPSRFLFHPPSGYSEKELKEKDSYGIHICQSLWTQGRL